MFAVIWKNWDSLTLLVGIQNGTTTLESSLEVCQKVKHRVTIWSSNSIPRYVSKKTEADDYTETYIRVLTALLFITVKNVDDPTSISWWRTDKMWSADNVEYSDQIRSVAQSCPTLCDPMNRSTPGLPVHHQLPEFTQTHVHQVSDAIQPSHPLSSPSPPAPNPSQRQSLFQWVNSSHEVAKVLEFQL